MRDAIAQTNNLGRLMLLLLQLLAALLLPESHSCGLEKNRKAVPPQRETVGVPSVSSPLKLLVCSRLLSSYGRDTGTRKGLGG
jgi:hypothetical protein